MRVPTCLAPPQTSRSVVTFFILKVSPIPERQSQPTRRQMKPRAHGASGNERTEGLGTNIYSTCNVEFTVLVPVTQGQLSGLSTALLLQPGI